ncbi:MAG: thiamine diphosphokinase [Roseburia sp.]
MRDTKTLIVAGGEIEQNFGEKYIADFEPRYVIAADRGLEFCAKACWIPDCVVGDYDSVEPAILEHFRGIKAIQWVNLIPEKDDTDTEAAVRLAIEKGSSCVSILGATGSRIDHVLGNIQLLYQLHRACVEGFLVDACNRIRLVSGTCVITKKEQFGKYVSVLPFGSSLSEVTLRGMKYPLHHGRISLGTTLGISNEIMDEQAEISVGEDYALIIESRDYSG